MASGTILDTKFAARPYRSNKTENISYVEVELENIGDCYLFTSMGGGGYHYGDAYIGLGIAFKTSTSVEAFIIFDGNSAAYKPKFTITGNKVRFGDAGTTLVYRYI